jgi:hypothetical protein
MMRVAHWYAFAIGERSSEGEVTGAARNAYVWQESERAASSHNAWEGRDLRLTREAPGSAEITRQACTRTGNLSQVVGRVNRQKRDLCFFSQSRSTVPSPKPLKGYVPRGDGPNPNAISAVKPTWEWEANAKTQAIVCEVVCWATSAIHNRML